MWRFNLARRRLHCLKCFCYDEETTNLLHMKRIFLALSLPADIRDFIANIIEKLRRADKSGAVRWVDPAGAHITLHFLGDQSDGAISAASAAIQPIAARMSFIELETSGLNCFPNQRQPRVIFLETIERGAVNLPAFVRELDQALMALGYKIDNKPWHPHITLGRVKGAWQCLRQLPKFFPRQFTIKELTLFESKLTPRGSKYTIIQSFSFLAEKSI